MIARVAAFSVPHGPPTALTAPATPAAPSLLAQMVDWALGEPVGWRLEGLAAHLGDRAERVALVGTHLAAIGALSRDVGPHAAVMIERGRLIDLGHVRLKGWVSGTVSPEPGMLFVASGGRALAEEKARALRAAVQRALNPSRGEGPAIVLGSFGQAEPAPNAATIQTHLSLGAGRLANEAEQEVEGAVWTHIEHLAAAVQTAAVRGQPLDLALNTLIADLGPHGRIQQLVPQTRIMTGKALGQLNALLKVLDRLLRAGELDGPRAARLVSESVARACEEVRAHDEGVTAGIDPATLLGGRAAVAAGASPAADVDWIVGKGRLGSIAENRAEEQVWAALEHALDQLEAAHGDPASYRAMLDRLRRTLSPGGELRKSLIGVRVVVRDPLCRQWLPAIRGHIDALAANTAEPAAVTRALRSALDVVRIDLAIHDAGVSKPGETP